MDTQIVKRNDIEGRIRYFFLFLVFLPTLLTFMKALDNDLWFLLNHGRYVSSNGFPSIEPFTIHTGLRFVMQQWLSGVIFYITYNTFGAFGIRFLVFTSHLITVVVFYRLSMRLSRGYFALTFLLSFFFSFFISYFMVARPYIFNSLIVILQIYLLELYSENKNRKYLIFIPFISILQVNLQAAMWPMMSIILVPYLFDSLKLQILKFKGAALPIKDLLVVLFLIILTGIINPYGLEGMSYLKRSYGVDLINKIVSEMNPADVSSFIGAVIILTIIINLLAYALSSKEDIPLRYFLLFLGTAYLSLSSIRGFMLLLVCGVFSLSYILSDVKIKEIRSKSDPRTILIRKTLSIMICIGLLVLVYQFNKNKDEITNYDMHLEMIQLVLSDKDTKNVRLYTGYNDGNLAQFYGLATYLDCRAEVFLKSNNGKEDILQEYYNLQTGSLYYTDFLDKYAFTHLLTNKYDILYTYLLKDPNFVLIGTNENYRLFKAKTE